MTDFLESLRALRHQTYPQRVQATLDDARQNIANRSPITGSSGRAQVLALPSVIARGEVLPPEVLAMLNAFQSSLPPNHWLELHEPGTNGQTYTLVVMGGHPRTFTVDDLAVELFDLFEQVQHGLRHQARMGLPLTVSYTFQSVTKADPKVDQLFAVLETRLAELGLTMAVMKPAGSYANWQLTVTAPA